MYFSLLCTSVYNYTGAVYLKISIFRSFHMLSDEWVCDCDSMTVSATWQQLHHDTMTGVMMTWWHVTTAQSTLYSRPRPYLALSSHVECCAMRANYDMAPALGGVAQQVIWSALSLSFVASFHCLWTAVSCLVSPAAWWPYPRLSSISSSLPSVP